MRGVLKTMILFSTTVLGGIGAAGEEHVCISGVYPRLAVFNSVVNDRGQTVTHEFPEGYSAHWVRVKASRPCRATAYFIYM